MAKNDLKFDVRVPNTVEEALQFDKDNDNDLWAKSIEKELKNVRIAFELLQEGEKIPVGSKLIPYHFIFDVKYDLTWKSRCVAGGHCNKNVPAHTTYSSVVPRDSIRLTLMLAALNGLSVLSVDIGNAYLNAKNREKTHVICGKELFGAENEGKVAIVVCALYGLKSVGAVWQHHFSSYITDTLGFESKMADPECILSP
mmetsp:Transcript_10258/g.14494  ORF Transcript_10258/g.14494 Transcript_10258/m.14494 type:complete len:199 (+) Transcript_10258:2647-3243(+)